MLSNGRVGREEEESPLEPGQAIEEVHPVKSEVYRTPETSLIGCEFSNYLHLS